MNKNNFITITLVIFFIILSVVSVALITPYAPEEGKDWPTFLRPATLRLLSGSSPYTEPFANPPWTLLPLIPLALLPPRLGSAILVIASPLIFGMIAHRAGGKILPVLFFSFSSPVVHNAFNVNIDFLPALGLIMPPQIGLFFIMMKPQIAIGVAIYWFIQAWCNDGIKGIIITFWPVTAAFIISFLIYGMWPVEGFRVVSEMAQNTGDANLFPWSVPFGVVILVYALLGKDKILSISASPLLSPYVAMHSWSGFLLGLMNYPLLSITFCILSWVITIIAWSI